MGENSLEKHERGRKERKFKVISNNCAYLYIRVLPLDVLELQIVTV